MQHIVRMMWIFRILLEKKVSVTRIPVVLLWRCESSLPPGLALQDFAKRKCFLAMVRWCGIYSVPARHLGLTRFSEWRGIQMQLKETLRDPKLHRQAITDFQKHPGDVIEIYWNPVSLWLPPIKPPSVRHPFLNRSSWSDWKWSWKSWSWTLASPEGRKIDSNQISQVSTWFCLKNGVLKWGIPRF